MIVDYLSKPSVVLIIFILFLIGYLIFMDVEGGFSKKFLRFGPGTTDENTTKFIGIKIDSWSKVITLYAISFLTSLMISYYDVIIYNNIHRYVWNPAITHIPYSKFWTYTAILSQPLFNQLLLIIQFYMALTLQLQFIIPQFMGEFIAQLPFSLQTLGRKTYK
jgi:hypothetical protein